MTGGDRFRRLERERPQSAEEGPKVASDRFAPANEPQAIAAIVSGVAGSRFAPAEERLELDSGHTDEMPFVRCAACQVDSGKQATQCSGCGASLGTAEQHAFNDQLWKQLQEAKVAEQAQSLEIERHRTESAIDEAKTKQRLLEGVAREARSAALGESGASGGPGVASGWYGPWGRRAIGVVLVVAGYGLAAAGRHGSGGLSLCGIVTLFTGSILLFPAWAWTREVSRWRGRWF